MSVLNPFPVCIIIIIIIIIFIIITRLVTYIN